MANSTKKNNGIAVKMNKQTKLCKLIKTLKTINNRNIKGVLKEFVI